jgi:hypothetical protein
VRAAGGFLVAALPARARNDDVGTRGTLLEDEAGEQVLEFGRAQVDARGAGQSPFLRGVCRARIAARNACA